MTTHKLVNTCSALLLTATSALPCLAQTRVPNPLPKKSQPTLATGVIQEKPKVLLPEGFQISGRNAKLIKHPTDQRWFLKVPSSPSADDPFSVDPNSDDPFANPLEVLPCQWLTKMVSVTGQKTDLSITFRVWAEVTTYQDKNYLLPKDVYTLSLFGSPSDPPAETSPVARPGGVYSSQTDDTLKVDATDPNDKFKLPAKLRQALLKSPRPQPILIENLNNDNGTSTSSTMKSFTVGGTTRTDLAENHMVANRVGRIAYDPDSRYWLFAFEADTQSLAEPPIALLPAQLLEIVEKTLQKNSQPVKFRISGQVTRYQNKNYLLLRKLLIVLDRGNLGK